LANPPYSHPRAYNPYYEPPPRRFGTSRMELLHIAGAMLILAAVLYIVIDQADGFENVRQKLPREARMVAALLISLFGFVLHELGHKFTAQHFGHWSEFRANWFFLGFALLLALSPWHLTMAAPGATWHTAQGKKEQGKISAMGPLVNYAVAFVAVPFTLGRGNLVVQELAGIVVAFSTILALFNLIPLGPLDGRKILAWNPIIWIVMLGLGVGLIIWQNHTLFTG